MRTRNVAMVSVGVCVILILVGFPFGYRYYKTSEELKRAQQEIYDQNQEIINLRRKVDRLTARVVVMTTAEHIEAFRLLQSFRGVCKAISSNKSTASSMACRAMLEIKDEDYPPEEIDLHIHADPKPAIEWAQDAIIQECEFIAGKRPAICHELLQHP